MPDFIQFRLQGRDLNQIVVLLLLQCFFILQSNFYVSVDCSQYTDLIKQNNPARIRLHAWKAPMQEQKYLIPTFYKGIGMQNYNKCAKNIQI